MVDTTKNAYVWNELEPTRASWFCLAVVVSFMGYYLLFAHILHKPQTIGQHRELIDAKTVALEKIATTNKIVILAGSNGRVSHSAQIVEAMTGKPSVNMSVTASMSIDFQLNRIKEYLIPGDVIYMPLEYGQLARSRKVVYSGVEAPYTVAYEKSSLAEFPLERKINAYLYFDLHFVFSSVAEMGLSAMDFKRRITADDYNEWGDQTGHTVEKGEPYRDYIENASARPSSTVDIASYSAVAVADFLAWASEHGVLVVGGYPTYAVGEDLPQEADQKLKEFYQTRGHKFLDLGNKARYPKAYFFDTIYHLSEPYQIEHSRLVGEHLKELLEL